MAAAPGGADLAKVLPEAPPHILRLRDGSVVAAVCENAADASFGRRAILWVRDGRVVAIQPPKIEAGYVVEMSGERVLPSCPDLVDVADLDGDGRPELLLLRFDDQHLFLDVVTLAEPPVPRGSAPALPSE